MNAQGNHMSRQQKKMKLQGRNNPEATRPWWRQRWPWLLMAGPAAAIVGCIVTIVLAFQGFSDQAVFDGGVKRGLVVEKITAQTPSPQSR
jgi:hypothetical protein